MATGGADIAPLLEELLTCAVCIEEFNSTTRPPRVLPCHHSFCAVCLQKLTKDGKVKCPKCRQEAAADKPFPMETVRVSVMDWKQSVLSLKSKESPEKLIQTLCEKCDSHPDKNMDVFCLTCDKAVCSICALTQHLEGHKFVELPKVLEDTKKKILAVCEKLDEAQEGFQKKAEESEASLQALESNHRKAEKNMKDTFSSVVSTAMERQAKALEELSAEVETERLKLEEQLEKFRSLQAATQSAADYGRQLVFMSLLCEAKSASADLERTAADLQKKLSTPVTAAATFKVGTEKLEELRALLESLGTTESVTDAVPAAVAAAVPAAVAAAVPAGVRDLPVVIPDIRLDGSRCHGDCTVSADGCSLSNKPHPPGPSQSQMKFRFRGTCGTLALPSQTCYWQVHVKALPNPQIALGRWLCECGVSSMQGLQVAVGWVEGIGRRAITVGLVSTQGSVNARVLHSGSKLTETVLAPFNPHSPVERTLGFLLDAQRKRLAILDVDGRQVLCEREVAMSLPLWPCVSVVHPASLTHFSVCVRVESGQQVTLTPDVVGLIQNLLS